MLQRIKRPTGWFSFYKTIDPSLAKPSWNFAEKDLKEGKFPKLVL